MSEWARCFGDLSVPWHALRATGDGPRTALCGAKPSALAQVVWHTALEHKPAWPAAPVCPICAYLETVDPVPLFMLLSRSRHWFRELLDNYGVQFRHADRRPIEAMVEAITAALRGYSPEEVQDGNLTAGRGPDSGRRGDSRSGAGQIRQQGTAGAAERDRG